MLHPYIVKIICSLFPPIFSQSVREQLISVKRGEDLGIDFKRNSFTGSVFYGNTSDFHAFKFMIHGYFDWRNVVLARSILKFKKGHIVEVGANIGTETIGFVDVNKNHNVIAFEPLAANFKSLKDIKQINKLTNLILFPYLVSDQEGEAYFKVPPKNSSGAGHIASKETKNVTSYKVVTLDKIIEDKEQVALIVADVEGYEYQVLKGGETILSKSNPFLILEVNERFINERAKITLLDFYDHIVQQGYQCYYIHRLGLHKVDPANFDSKKNKNWLCIPNKYHLKTRSLHISLMANALNPFIRYIKF